MTIYEVYIGAYRWNEDGSDDPKEYYFTKLKDAVEFVQNEKEPQITTYEIYSMTISRITPAKQPKEELLRNALNRKGWIASREEIRKFEYDYETGKRRS